MGSSHSKISYFEEPKEYQNASLEVFTSWIHNGRTWHINLLTPKVDKLEIRMHCYTGNTRAEIMYQFVFAHKHKPKKKIVMRGVGKVDGRNSGHVYHYDRKFSEKKLDDYQINFQVIFITHLHSEIRMFDFLEGVFGHSKNISTGNHTLTVPMMDIIERAPFLVKNIEEDKLSRNEKMPMYEFLQILHGVQIQISEDLFPESDLKGIMKLATKYKVLIVKRYCEDQLIRSDDFEFSEKEKFKMACKYNLNILMNQLLREVKTVKKLAKLASIAVEMNPMDPNISKLLIVKMYQIS